jgi:hypothetical protein
MEIGGSPLFKTNSRTYSCTRINIEINNSNHTEAAPVSPVRINRLRKPHAKRFSLKRSDKSNSLNGNIYDLSGISSFKYSHKSNSLDTQAPNEMAQNRLQHSSSSIIRVSPKRSPEQRIIKALQNISHKPVAIDLRHKRSKGISENKLSVSNLLNKTQSKLNYSYSHINPYRNNFSNISQHQNLNDVYRRVNKKLRIMTKPRLSDTQISLLNVSRQESKILDSYFFINRHHNSKLSSIVPYKPADFTISPINPSSKDMLEDFPPAQKKRRVVFRSMGPSEPGGLGNKGSICSWKELETP